MLTATASGLAVVVVAAAVTWQQWALGGEDDLGAGLLIVSEFFFAAATIDVLFAAAATNGCREMLQRPQARTVPHAMVTVFAVLACLALTSYLVAVLRG